MKVVINRSHGGFDVSDETLNKLRETKKKSNLYEWELDRHDSDLIRIIEEMGIEKAQGKNAKLKIVEIPDGVAYEIQEYDGVEWIAEIHRKWC